MFIYLTYCPDKITFLYKHLFRNFTTKEILLTLTYVSRESTSYFVEQTAEEIWNNVTKTLGLVHHVKIMELVDGRDNSTSPVMFGLYEIKIF